jgi:uncharacterized membrane protein
LVKTPDERKLAVTIQKTLIVVIVLVLISVAASLIALPRLPEMVPSHWNAAGEIDGYASRTFSLIFMPAVTLGLGLFMLYLPQIDPLRANVDKFRVAYNWTVIGFCAYMLYIHILTLLAGLGVRFNMTSMMLPAMGLLFIGLGFVIDRAKRNWFIGIRTPWTLMSDSVWQKTHRLGGLLFKIGGAVTAVVAFFPGEAGIWIMLVALLGAGFVPVIYSYFAYRVETH